MSMSYIRKTYGVPAKRGGKVRVPAGSLHGRPERLEGTIASAGRYVRVRVPGWEPSVPFHPWWHMEYLDAEGRTIWPVTDEQRQQAELVDLGMGAA